MAQFSIALQYVLYFEDSQRQFASVPDVGGFAISGINSHSFPADYAAIDVTPQAQRGPLVSAFYQKNFWSPANLDGLNSQDLANRVMDESVNGGLGTGERMLQRVANSRGATLTEDGQIGPATLAAVNAIDPGTIVQAYKDARVALYRAIAVLRPEDAKYLTEWLARANA